MILLVFWVTILNFLLFEPVYSAADCDIPVFFACPTAEEPGYECRVGIEFPLGQCKCPNSDITLTTVNAICDFINDCDDGSDESDSICGPCGSRTYTTGEGINADPGFACNNGQCIPSGSICNGIADCNDNSDETEELCSTTTPSISPTLYPSNNPSINPSNNPSSRPTIHPTSVPTQSPSINPTINPSSYPTSQPSIAPTNYPTESPLTTRSPTKRPVNGGYRTFDFTKLKGKYIMDFFVSSEKDCVNSCQIKNNCHYWTYKTNNNRCRLLGINDVTEIVPKEFWIAGCSSRIINCVLPSL